MSNELSNASLVAVVGGQSAGNFAGPCNLPKLGAKPTPRELAGQRAVQSHIFAIDDADALQARYCGIANDAGIGFDFAQRLAAEQLAP